MTCFHMEMTPSRVAMGRRRLSASGSQFASAQSDMGTAETHTTGQQSRQGLRRNSAVSRQRHTDSRRIPLDRYKDVSTTMICCHVLNRGWAGVRSPVDKVIFVPPGPSLEIDRKDRLRRLAAYRDAVLGFMNSIDTAFARNLTPAAV